MCLVLGSSDRNYKTKQMASGDARDPWVMGQQIGTQSLKTCIFLGRFFCARKQVVHGRINLDFILPVVLLCYYPKIP